MSFLGSLANKVAKSGFASKIKSAVTNTLNNSNISSLLTGQMQGPPTPIPGVNNGSGSVLISNTNGFMGAQLGGLPVWGIAVAALAVLFLLFKKK